MSWIHTRRQRAATAALLFSISASLAATAQNPPSRDAVETQISAHLAKRNQEQALSTYDAYVAATKKPDMSLLGLVARAELRQAVESYPNDATLRSAALERLARAGDVEALQALKRQAASNPLKPSDAAAVLASLIRLNDRDAEARLGALLDSTPPGGKAEILRALREANARSQSAKVAVLLNDPDPQVRMAAARTVGALGYQAAIPQLRAVFERDVAVVRMFAGPALKRLGDPSADAHVAQLLSSESPDMRMAAAEAYPASPGAPWVASIKALRTDRNELTRVRAAEVIACCDPATARAILNEALAHPIPSMRVEAARIYELKNLADATSARRLLGDTFDQVRLHGAGAVLRLSRAAAAQK